jgi:hypothetical protein
VERTAQKVWAYQASGKNWIGHGRHVVTREGDFLALVDQQDALVLLMKLRFEHEGWRPEFAASPKGMAAARVIPGWGDKRYRRALAILVERGFLDLLHKGSACIGDHDLYALADKGADSAPNTNKTPRPRGNFRSRLSGLFPLAGELHERRPRCQPAHG